MVKELFRRIKARQPQIGDIWMVDDADLGIPGGGEHPVVVIRGQSLKGGPVLAAPGSSSRWPRPQDHVYGVFPGDCDPPDQLASYTRFRLNHVRTRARRELKRFKARLRPEKIEELKAMRRRLIE